MKSLLAWILFPFYFSLTLATLVIWDIVLKLLWRFARSFHKPVLDAGVGLLLVHLRILGTKFKVRFHAPLPADVPLVVISNHQSVFDIPLLMWYLRKCSPVFVSKKELGKWIPSVSCTLRSNGSVLIDRADATQAIPAIRQLGQLIESRKIGACIFPEGTRARNGEMRKFKPSGLLNLIESSPTCLVIPIAIDGSWELVRHGLLPIPIGVTVTLDILPALNPRETPGNDLVGRIQSLIQAQLKARSC